MSPEGRIWIGCSGWLYRGWKGRFYPDGLPVSSWLEYYADRFPTVELNNSFYRLPERRTFGAWGRATPHEFVFAVKASRYLTHLKRLIAPHDPVARLLTRAYGLGPRLGPLLYQLPPTMRYDSDRLDGFLMALRRVPARVTLTRAAVHAGVPSPPRHVIEFRDASWYRPDVFDRLAVAGVALCLHDKSEGRYLGDPVGPFVYVRFHGTSGSYAGSYADGRLAEWAERITRWSRQGRNVFAYFNNDPDAAAPRNALTLSSLTRRAGGCPESSARVNGQMRTRPGHVGIGAAR
jgi:uncharacterized protein YecE (DUF72 family)